jgi:hypothetical protein
MTTSGMVKGKYLPAACHEGIEKEVEE